MQCLKHGLWMGFSNAEEGAGGVFRAAVALFPVLKGAGTDADEGGKLNLAESEFFTNGIGVRCLEGGAARAFLFSAQDGTAFLEAGGELLEEFVFHGNSVSMMDFEDFELSGREIFLFVFRVGKQEKNDTFRDMPLVDNAKAAALATTRSRPAELSQPVGTTDEIAAFRIGHERPL
jgi:hypothetical protein